MLYEVITLRGGTRVVQYRDKKRPDSEQLAIAKRMLQLCRQWGATFIVNDDPVIAQARITSYNVCYTKLLRVPA